MSSWQTMRKFFRTPKGLLTLVLAALVAIAAPHDGLPVVLPGLTAAVIAAGIIPAGLEMMDKPMTAAVEDFVKAGYDLTAEAILLCESDGTPEEVAEEVNRMLDVLTGCGATRLEVSRDEAEHLIMQARVKAGWIDASELESAEPEQELADGEAE
mgnify:CR=1 FL=1